MKKGKNILIVGILIITLVVIYVVSYGPFLFLVNYCNFDKKWQEDLLVKTRMIYYPHALLTENSEIYFNYTLWWARLGGYQGHWSWEDQKILFSFVNQRSSLTKRRNGPSVFLVPGSRMYNPSLRVPHSASPRSGTLIQAYTC